MIVATWVREWESSSWLKQAQDWISRVLKAYGVTQTGPMRQVTRNLAATVWIVPSDQGSLFFKAAAPPRVHEAELVARIAPVSRGHVPTPLAAEAEAGWLLFPDLGTALSRDSRSGDLATTRRVFSDAAELQLALSDAQEQLAEGGMPGLLPSYIPEYLEEALHTHASLPREHPLSISEADAALLSRGLETVQLAASMLDEVPVPATLQQGTLSPEQIIVPGSHRSPVIFIGWGQSRWAHPFELVGTAVEQLCAAHDCEPTDDPVKGILNAYLMPFTRFAPMDTLRELVAPALLLSHAQHHEVLMDLVMAAEAEDQAAAAPEVMAVLAAACAVQPSSRRGSRHQGARVARATGARAQAQRSRSTRASASSPNTARTPPAATPPAEPVEREKPTPSTAPRFVAQGQKERATHDDVAPLTRRARRRAEEGS